MHAESVSRPEIGIEGAWQPRKIQANLIGENSLWRQSDRKRGVATLELADRAAELFEKQPASEKRRLLNFVLSNSFWGNGQLTVEFRQPSDLIAVGATELKQKKAAGVSSDGLHQVMYTRRDSIRCENTAI